MSISDAVPNPIVEMRIRARIAASTWPSTAARDSVGMPSLKSTIVFLKPRAASTVPIARLSAVAMAVPPQGDMECTAWTQREPTERAGVSGRCSRQPLLKQRNEILFVVTATGQEINKHGLQGVDLALLGHAAARVHQVKLGNAER